MSEVILQECLNGRYSYNEARAMLDFLEDNDFQPFDRDIDDLAFFILTYGRKMRDALTEENASLKKRVEELEAQVFKACEKWERDERNLAEANAQIASLTRQVQELQIDRCTTICTYPGKSPDCECLKVDISSPGAEKFLAAVKVCQRLREREWDAMDGTTHIQLITDEDGDNLAVWAWQDYQAACRKEGE